MPNSFRIATYNLEDFDDEVPDDVFAGRLAALQPVFAAMAADVVCLQEINAQPRARSPRLLRAVERLLAGTPYESYNVACSEAQAGHGPADKHNLVVLSRFPIVAARSIRHALVPPPVHGLPVEAGAASGKAEDKTAMWDRPLQHVTLGLPDERTLEIINLHLRAPLASHIAGATLAPQIWRSTQGWAEGFYVSALKRIGQALEARLLVERLFDADPKALLAVTGDLNADSLEMPIRLLRADVADTRNDLLARRRLEPAEARLPAERRFSVRYAGRVAMYDHILLSSALLGALEAVEILNRDLEDEAVAARAGEATASSFHAPLIAAFRL